MMNESVTEIVSSVWQALLGLEVSAVAPPAVDSAHAVTACIRISGAWSGAVVARVEPELARRISAIMLDQPLEATSDADALDCLGELVNMFGGNLKALLPGPCTLSLPWVSAEGSKTSALAQLDETTRVGLESEGSVFTISVLSDTRTQAHAQEQQP